MQLISHYNVECCGCQIGPDSICDSLRKLNLKLYSLSLRNIFPALGYLVGLAQFLLLGVGLQNTQGVQVGVVWLEVGVEQLL